MKPLNHVIIQSEFASELKDNLSRPQNRNVPNHFPFTKYRITASSMSGYIGSRLSGMKISALVSKSNVKTIGLLL